MKPPDRIKAEEARRDADAAYKRLIGRRRRAAEQLAADLAAQHRASLPVQPVVERLRPPTAVVVGRKSSNRMFGEQ